MRISGGGSQGEDLLIFYLLGERTLCNNLGPSDDEYVVSSTVGMRQDCGPRQHNLSTFSPEG